MPRGCLCPPATPSYHRCFPTCGAQLLGSHWWGIILAPPGLRGGETERTEGVAALLGRGGVRESFLPLKNWAVWSRLHPRGTLSLGSAAAGRFRKGVGRMG